MTSSAESSVEYRKRASCLNHRADIEPDIEKAWPLIREALFWMQLAENEECPAMQGIAVDAAPINASPLERQGTGG